LKEETACRDSVESCSGDEHRTADGAAWIEYFVAAADVLLAVTRDMFAFNA